MSKMSKSVTFGKKGLKAGLKIGQGLARKKTGRKGANRLQRVQFRREQRRKAILGLGKTGWKRLAWVLPTLGLLCGLTYGAWKGFQAYGDGRILTVNRIEVEGNHYWESSQLLERAGLEIGSGLPGVSLRSARAALRQLPGIQEVTVHASLDGELRVQVKEEEILALRQSDGWLGLTPTGAWMPLRTAPADLPIVDLQAGTTPKDVAALAIFLEGAHTRYPQLFEGFSEISMRGPDEADIYWRDGNFKMRVDYTNKSLNSLEFLSELLPQEKATWPSGSTVDLRVEGYAYVL
jgi:cell division septal protein FtsQ